MGSKFDENTKEGLSREVKELRQQCVDTCHIIEDSPLGSSISTDNIDQAALCYVDGLRMQVQSSETVVPTDENFVVSQFLGELKAKREDVQKLIAYTRASILDFENETQRLKSLRVLAEEALSKPRVKRNSVTPQQIARAKEDFRVLKTELHGLIRSIFKNDSDLVFEIIGSLMEEQLKENCDGYIEVTNDNALILEILKDINVISENPYNKNEVKLAY